MHLSNGQLLTIKCIITQKLKEEGITEGNKVD